MFREARSGTRTIIGVDANVELGNLPRSELIGHPTRGEGHPTARAQAFRRLLKAKKLFACNTFGLITDIATDHVTHIQRNGGRTSQKDFILDTWGPPISVTIEESTGSDHRRVHSVLALPAPRSAPWKPPFDLKNWVCSSKPPYNVAAEGSVTVAPVSDLIGAMSHAVHVAATRCQGKTFNLTEQHTTTLKLYKLIMGLASRYRDQCTTYP